VLIFFGSTAEIMARFRPPAFRYFSQSKRRRAVSSRCGTNPDSLFAIVSELPLCDCGDQFRAAFAEARYVQDTLDGGVFACMRNLRINSFQPHDDDFGIHERLEVQRSSNSSSYCSCGFFLLVDDHLLSGVLQHVRYVIRSTFAGLAVPAKSRARNWIPISAGVHCCTLISRAVSRISAFFVFKSSVIGALLAVAWRAFFLALGVGGGGGGGSAGSPASNRRYFTTFCYVRSVAAKKCPPRVLATK